jgi:predicted ferric reductase
VAGALAICALWWHDTTSSSVHGAGPALSAVGSLTGLIGTYLVLVQLLLLARLPWFERAVGFDRLAAWHRALGTNVVVLLCIHATLVTVGYGLTDHRSAVAEAWQLLSTYHYVPEAAIGLGLFVVVAVTSARRARRRISYEAWYWVHVSVYAAIVLAVFHQLADGVDFVGHPWNRALWIFLYAAVAGCIVTTRLGAPLRAHLRHRLRVERVVAEGPGVVSVWMRGRDIDGLQLRSGQFFLWRFLAPGHWMSAHPYSVSGRQDGSRIRITVKAAGDHSAALAHMAPGTRVVAEGPFGHFTSNRRTQIRSLLVAGGSGIAPIRLLAETLAERGGGHPSRVMLLYRVSRPSDAVFYAELEDLVWRGALTVEYLVGTRAELGRDPLDAANIRRLVPDVAQRDVWVCGPAGMTASLRRTLHRLGVPRGQVHTEDFSLW